MRPYEEGGGLDALFKASPGETIIGSHEAKRSTKTWVSSERSGIVLGFIENHARSVVRTLQRLHLHHYGRELTPLEVVDIYPGAKRWVELHQELVEHFASIEGFSVSAVVRMEEARLMNQKNRPESSIGTGAGDRAGDT